MFRVPVNKWARHLSLMRNSFARHWFQCWPLHDAHLAVAHSLNDSLVSFIIILSVTYILIDLAWSSSISPRQTNSLFFDSSFCWQHSYASSLPVAGVIEEGTIAHVFRAIDSADWHVSAIKAPHKYRCWLVRRVRCTFLTHLFKLAVPPWMLMYLELHGGQLPSGHT